jgi:Zn-dependent protease
MSFNSLMSWNFKLYRAFGIDVRIHWLLILYIVVKVLSTADKVGHIPFIWLIAGPLIIFTIVLLHEYGHCIAARMVGGRADNIILWPLGGLAMCWCPQTPRAEFITAFGGPFVNCLMLAAGYLIRWLLPPEAPGASDIFLTFILDVNLTLFLFNLIPCYPLDGGRIFRALLWPVVGYSKAGFYTLWLAIIISGGLLMYGLITSDISLVFIALFTFIQAWQEKQAGGGYSAGHAVPAGRSTAPPILEKWRDDRKQKAIKKEMETEKDIKSRVDRILDKINDAGMEHLSNEERRFLNEASQYLNRNSPPH